MKNQILAIIVFIGCFSAALARKAGGPPMDIFDLRVYRIESRRSHEPDSNVTEVLTASYSNTARLDSNGTIVATTSAWIGDASQKWRLDASALYNSFLLHPTNNEDFDLEYDDTGNFFHYVGSWGFGYNRLWYLIDAGDGYHLIKNHYNEVCLQANELKSAVGADICNNSVNQQWRLVFLSKDA